MPPATTQPTAACHLVAAPYPGRGHINAMLNLCNLVASRRRLLVTVVVTEEWRGLIGLDGGSAAANVRFDTIPNVLPSELGRAADMEGFVEATFTKMEEPFERVLDRLEPPATVIVADTFLPWAVDVGNRRKIPVASFWPMPASVFSIFHHFDLIVHNRHFPFEISERGEERIDYIPGLTPLRLADLPTIIRNKDGLLLNRARHVLSKTRKSQYLLFHTIFHLESPAINALKPNFPSPIISFGPLIPRFNLQNHNHPHYLQWLDSQPRSSVLYVSLGSFLSVSSAQMDEFLAGLNKSGVRYLLVAREKISDLQEACDGAGMVVRWCDQLRVLCHSTVGGFWTHCGWNSTMEAVFAGVPLLAFPIMMDQVTISKLVVEDWKIGWKVRGDGGKGGLVTREEIAGIVRRFMDSENGEREEMVKRAKEMQETCRRAIEVSESTLDAFIKDISR